MLPTLEMIGDSTFLRILLTLVKHLLKTDILHLNSKSCYLVGKDDKIAPIFVNHPSCSRQHAVIQFRKVNKTDTLNESVNVCVLPYLMDLESTNGTLLNKEKIEQARYYELKPLDIINFGYSSRDYVVMKAQENSL